MIKKRKTTNSEITQVDTTLNSNPQTLLFSITYLPYGGVTGLTYGNSLSLSHGYDNQYRTSSIVVVSILARTYNYDSNGNITYIDDAEAAGNEALETAGIYSYDQGTNLLADMWREIPVVYDYDENGNTISVDNRTFTYDLSNRLIAVQEASTNLGQYVYNALNQRIKKILSTETRIFHYDLQGHLIAETNEGGTTLVEYFYLGDQPLAMIRPSEALYYYHNDHLGTPQILTNDSGTVSWKAVYTPFGEAEISIGTVENDIRLPGQYYDSETGLHYNWNRYYDPKTGRYLTPDAIESMDESDLFVYVENNPINQIDSLGLVAIRPPIDPRNYSWIYWKDFYNYCYAWRIWGHQRYPLEPNSSMRHCVVSCVIASKYGSGHTRLAGAANEIEGLFKYDIPDICGRLRGQRPWAFQWQDFKDNERGIECAKKNKCNDKQETVLENCTKCCQGK
jgi:RHS repeat-associated protein